MKRRITQRQYKQILKEQLEDTIEIDAKEYLDWLKRFQFDSYAVANIKKFRNKKFIINGDLDLFNNKKIKSLINVIKVEGYLDLTYSTIESLPKLEYVGKDLDLDNTNIQSLDNLKYVGSYLSLKNTPLSKTTTKEELRNKIDIKGNLYL